MDNCKAEKCPQNKRTQRNPKPLKPGKTRTGGPALHHSLRVAVLAAFLLAMGTVPVLAADDPLTTINNLSDFIFSAIRAVGIIMLGFGVVQIGLSLKSHDASQRANGIMTFFGGVLIAFAKTILDLILA